MRPARSPTVCEDAVAGVRSNTWRLIELNAQEVFSGAIRIIDKKWAKTGGPERDRFNIVFVGDAV
jgi:hypothetical protein